MAAFALRLGVRLEKPGVYLLHPGGKCPDAEDFARAFTFARVFGHLWIFAAGVVLLGVGR